MLRRSITAKNVILIVLLAVVVLWTLLIFSFSPSVVVERLGIGNGYLVAFVVAFFGGSSLFITTPYYVIVATLAAGGLEPPLLGVAAGIGVALGDSISYLVGRGGHDMLSGRLRRAIDKFCGWCMHQRLLVPVVLFVYVALVPLPNDLMVVPLGASRYPYRCMIGPMVLGNMVFNTLIAYIGMQGLRFL